jgi:hypothetical protein
MNSVNAATNARIDNTCNQILSLQKEMKDDAKAFHESMKDFHGRLCAIEERNKGK